MNFRLKLLSLMLVSVVLLTLMPAGIIISTAQAAPIPADNTSNGFVSNIAIATTNNGTTNIPGYSFQATQTEYTIEISESAQLSGKITISTTQDNLYCSIYLDGVVQKIGSKSNDKAEKYLIAGKNYSPQWAEFFKLFTIGETHTVTIQVGTLENDEYTASDVYNFVGTKTPGLKVPGTQPKKILAIKDTYGNELTTSPSYTAVANTGAGYAYIFSAVTTDTAIKLTAVPNSPTAKIYLGTTVTGAEDVTGASNFTDKEIALADFTEEDADIAVIPFSLRIYDGETVKARTDYTLFISQTAHTPIIERQPQSVICDKDADIALSLDVRKPDKGELSYQWCTTGNTSTAIPKPIVGATDAEYMPSTQYAGKSYYTCIVTNTVDGVKYQMTSSKANVTVNLTYISPLEFTTQPPNNPSYKNTYFVGGRPDAIRFNVTAPDKGTAGFEGNINISYNIWCGTSENLSSAQKMQLEDPLYSTSISLPTQMEAGTYYYFIEAIGSFDGLESVSTFSDPIALTFMKYEVNELQGLGTEAEPYLIASLADLEIVRGFIENGYYLVNDHLKLTADITLPQDWRPLGGLIDDPAELITNGASAGYSPEFKGTNVAPFSGILDGDGHTVTVAEGGLPLFAYVRTAEVRNLNIYGKKIASAGLVEKSFIDYGTSGNYWESSIGHTIKLENVTLKSGSSTLLSGFVNGSGSGVNAVNLTNCTVERGVTVGYDGTQNKIGSFVGTFNGEIGNCISYATVKGIDAVGGLAGCKGQAMGHCNLSNSAFLGDVVATGNGAGGIIGKGYVVSSAPATEFVAVRNCYVAANIAGADKVGGIIGDESGSHYYLDRSNEYGLFGSNSIKDNIFYGKITAIGDHVGGIVGYLYHFGKTSGVASNFWLETCGADASVGGFAPVGTEWNEYSSDEPQVVGLDLFASPATAAEFADGTVLAKLNASGTSSRNWIQGERHPVFSGSPVITGLEISGTYKTAYYIGDALDLSGMVFTAVWSNGDRTGIDPADVTVTGYDNTARAVQTLTAAYRNATAAFTVTVLKKPGEGGDAGAPANDTIDVYFTLLGAPVHDSEADGIFYLKKNNNLETWISRKSYTVNLNAKVLDVFDRALAEAGLSYKIRDRNYVWSITRNGVTLEEFTNGPNAGWQYTLNGRYSLLGVNEQFLENGDDIVFHYTDDWSKDSAADIVDPGGARSGGAAAPSDEKKTEKPETEAKSSTVVKDGEATATVDKEAKSGAGERLVVNVAAGGEAVSKITALLPKEVLKAESDGKSEIEIRSEIANVLLPEKAVAALSKSGADVTVKAAKDADGRYTFTVAAGDRTLDKVDGGIKATVPAPEARAGSVAVIVRADGTEEIVKKSCAKDGKFVIPLGGSATVKIVDNAKTFADVPPGAWYEANVAFASARELFGGTGANAFSPDAPMTRGMLVTVLHRLENAPDAGGDLFADVDGGAYYAGAAAWASANGIVTGTGDGNFAPGIGINREQLATILHRYAKALGTDTSAKGELSAFGDVGDASDWAAEALEWAVGAGLMRGRSGSDLAPKGPATRAEVAAMMERFIESLT